MRHLLETNFFYTVGASLTESFMVQEDYKKLSDTGLGISPWLDYQLPSALWPGPFSFPIGTLAIPR